MTALLEARNVTKAFGNPQKGGTVALQNFSFMIRDDVPSFTAVVGESGSGKTTLARILLGFLSPTTGEVRYRGTNLRLASRQEQRRFRREVQAIFQDPFEVYNPFYKVDHLLTTPIAKFKLAHSRAEARELIERALQAVGLRPDETLGRYPHQLSGGQRQRITVARAVLLGPKAIIADEPVSMVDASLRATILESLRTLHEQFGISFLYITHDLSTAYQVSDHVLVMYRGVVVEAGDVERVIKHPQHPYTQLLVASIPRPNPHQRWGDDTIVSPRAEAAPARGEGCAFADRCPYVMPICRESPPPLYCTEEHRAAACYLHEGAGTALTGDLTRLFGRQAAAAAEGLSRRDAAHMQTELRASSAVNLEDV